MFKPTFTPDQALPKAKHYCAYQERCHSEVKEKLCGFGLHKREIDQILSQLIEENYLNEERFAIQFAGGKFRIRQWGKVKIKYALRQKKVSDYCIRKALASIDQQEYEKSLHKLAEAKRKTLNGEKNIFIRNKKLQDHLLQRGFEAGLVRDLIARIL